MPLRPAPGLDGIEDALRRAFLGSGAAVRAELATPIPGEPFISIATAIELGARAIQELLT